MGVLRYFVDVDYAVVHGGNVYPRLAAFMSLCLFGCNDSALRAGVGVLAAEVQISGESPASGTPFQFGPRYIGRSTTANLRIKNNGTGSVVVTKIIGEGDIAIDESGSAFQLTFRETVKISKGDVAVIPLSFLPTEQRRYAARIHTTADGVAVADEEQTFSLEGEGVPDGCAFPSSIDFGEVVVGLSATRTTTGELNDAPTARATLATMFVEDPNAGVFVLVPEEKEIEPQSRRRLTVTFVPPTAGSFDAKLRVQPFADCGPTIVSLHGRGLEERIEASPSGVDFGFVPVGLTSTRTVTITNRTATTVSIHPLPLIGSPELQLTSPTVMRELAPEEGTTAEVACAPTGNSGYSGSVTIQTSRPGQPAIVIPVVCRGGGPDITATPLSVDLSRTGWVPGQMLVQRTDVLVRNVGTISNPINSSEGLHFSSPTFRVEPRNTNTTAAEIELVLPTSYDPVKGLQADGTVVPLRLGLRPSSAGEKLADIFIRSDDLDEPEVKVRLHATVIELPACTYALSATTLNFGRVVPGASLSLPLSVLNQTPGGDCLVESLTFAPGSSSTFSVSSPAVPRVLHAGERHDLNVTFAPPLGSGTPPTRFTARLRLQLSSPAEPEALVELDGEAGVGCLVASPMSVDFGTKSATCARLTKVVDVTNLCGNSVSIIAAGISQNGTSFSIRTAPTIPAAGLVIRPGIDTASFTLAFDGQQTGPDLGHLWIDWTDTGGGTRLVTPLQGFVATSSNQTDRWVQSDGKTDVLFIVGNDGSFQFNTYPDVQLPSRAGAFINFLNAASSDYHIGVTTYYAGSIDDMGMNQPYWPGQFWTSAFSPEPFLTPLTTNVVAKFQSKVSMPASFGGTYHGNAAVLGALTPPLSTSGKNAGFLRDDARLSVVYASDLAASYTPPAPPSIFPQDVVAQLRALRATATKPDVIVSAFMFLSPDCMGSPWQPTPFNVIQSSYFQESWAVAATGGVRSDGCPNPNGNAEAQRMAEEASGIRLSFLLSQVPGSVAAIEVRVNGVVVPALNGANVVWEYVASSNVVRFVSIATAPPKLSTVEITYPRVCN